VGAAVIEVGGSPLAGGPLAARRRELAPRRRENRPDST